MPAVGVFARAPIAGQAKTRLIPLLGPQGAAGLQAALVSDTLRKVAALKGSIQPYLFWTEKSTAFSGTVWDASFRILRQQGEDLGERLQNAFRRLLLLHPSCVVIGTDSPLIPPRILRQALDELRTCESVLGPCPDGGYYLIGLRRLADQRKLHGIFRSVRWSTAFAFRDTLRNLLRLDLSCSVLEGYADVDLPRDLQRLRKDLSRNPAARRLAPATWGFLKTSGVRCINSAQSRVANRLVRRST
jgi:hypothetical protein